MEWERRDLNPWRQEEKRLLLEERGGTCARDGCMAQAIDLDEPLVTRGDMGGLSLEQRRLAFSSVNMELACRICNREKAHDRDGAWERACKRYGRGTVVEWYLGIGLKITRKDWTIQNKTKGREHEKA